MHYLLFILNFLSFYGFASNEGQQRDNTGLDPTEIIGRLEFNYQYMEKEDGTVRQSIGTVFDKNLSPQALVGIELPVTYAEPPQGGAKQGVGDVTLTYKYSMGKVGVINTAIGGGFSLDTASEGILGEGTNTINLGMFNSYKFDNWLLANITFIKKSQDQEKDQITLVPLIAYQPLDRWYSYASLGFGFSFFTDTGEEAGTATFNLGKIMPNKDVYSLGTRFTIVGESDTDTVIQLGYRRLF